MKPRNKIERAAVEINNTLHDDIAVRDFDWIKRRSECIENWGCENYIYFILRQSKGGFEIKRLYRLYKYTDKNTSHYFVTEVMRQYIRDGRYLSFAQTRNGFGATYDAFAFYTDIAFRDNSDNDTGFYLGRLFHLAAFERRAQYGDRMKCAFAQPRELARIVVNNPIGEMLYKQGNELVSHLLYRTHIKQICRAYIIAKRHGYEQKIIDNYASWCDMVHALVVLGKDWHNPYYIAPADFIKMHDGVIRQYQRKRKEQSELRRQRELLRYAEHNAHLAEELARNRELEKVARERQEKAYIKARKRFFDMEEELASKNGRLTFHVLRDIDDFEYTASIMHDCVYTCQYYNLRRHPNSLIILSYVDGKKAELMEIDIARWTIVQCYAPCNQFGQFHDMITKYVTRKMDIIQQYASRNGKKAVKKAA